MVPYFGGVGVYTSYTSPGDAVYYYSDVKTATKGNFQGIGATGASGAVCAYSGASNNYSYAYLYLGGGGAGYGAGGGGGHAYLTGRYSYDTGSKYGGGAGQLKQNGFRVGIDLGDSIPVTVGSGGAGSTTTPRAPSSTAYGATLTTGNGAAGCVAIFW